MSLKIEPCEKCGVSVVRCDNDVLLDYPAVRYDEVKAPWTLFAGSYASVGNPSPNGRGHSLHEHQPEGSVMT